MTLIEIFNDIEQLAREVRGKLGYQPVDVRRKISSIANLAAIGRLHIKNKQGQFSRPNKCSAESHALKRMGGWSICPVCDEDISGG